MLAEAGGDRQVRGYLAWRAYNDAILACRRPLAEAARRQLGVLTALLPQDRRVLALRDQCPAAHP
jgi:hypothetical protein